jgi:alpha-N-dichloroacetyl-p-aminophenylserinol N-oxygenase
MLAAQDLAALNRKVMEHLAETWSDRVAVRKERIDFSQYYDPNIPDFPIEIIPFAQDPEFRDVLGQLDPGALFRFLSATWIAYNERVIFIEDDIVQPYCDILRRNVLPGVDDPTVQQVIVQTRVDEQFHTLMCLEVCNSARERHHLEDYVLPEPLLRRRLEDQLAGASELVDHALIRMAYATVSETTIHDYLKKLSSIMTIQPLNRLHTEMHRRDESSHGMVFLEIARSIYSALDVPLKARFTTYLTKALYDSVEIDMSFWASTLPYLDSRNWSSFIERMQGELGQKRIGREYTGLVRLLDDLGISDEIEFAFG